MQDSRRLNSIPRKDAGQKPAEEQSVVLPRGLHRPPAKASFNPFEAGPMAGGATFAAMVLVGLLLIQIISSALSPGGAEMSACAADSQAYDDSLALAQVAACLDDEALRLTP